MAELVRQKRAGSPGPACSDEVQRGDQLPALGVLGPCGASSGWAGDHGGRGGLFWLERRWRERHAGDEAGGGLSLGAVLGVVRGEEAASAVLWQWARGPCPGPCGEVRGSRSMLGAGWSDFRALASLNLGGGGGSGKGRADRSFLERVSLRLFTECG